MCNNLCVFVLSLFISLPTGPAEQQNRNPGKEQPTYSQHPPKTEAESTLTCKLEKALTVESLSVHDQVDLY